MPTRPAAQRLEACIARFGGTPIEDVATTLVFEPYRVMLRELQLAAYDHRDASLIEAGQAESAIPDLWRRAGSAPLREQTHLLLADALSRVGRATEALRVLNGFRTSLAEQSGLSPSSELDALVQRILQDDSSSTASESARGTTAANVTAPSTTCRRPRHDSSGAARRSNASAGWWATIGSSRSPASADAARPAWRSQQHRP